MGGVSQSTQECLREIEGVGTVYSGPALAHLACLCHGGTAPQKHTLKGRTSSSGVSPRWAWELPSSASILYLTAARFVGVEQRLLTRKFRDPPAVTNRSNRCGL